MRRALLAFLCVPFLLASAGARAQAPSTAETTLAAVIADYERLDKLADPLTAGQEGDREALQRLPDVRPETEAAQRNELIAIGKRLAAIDTRQLAPESALNLALLSRIVDQSVEGAGFDFSRIAFENDDGFHTLADYLARTTSISAREDADAWLLRLEALPAYYEQNIANLRRGIKTKFTQPRIVVDRVLAVARQQAATKAADSSLLLPFARMPANIPVAAQDQYRAKALQLVQDRILPVQRTFAEFLAREYVPAARAAIGWRSTPNGEATYRFLVRRETTTSMTPDEIHQLGLSEVARIRGLMESTIRETGFKGSFADFLQMLRSEEHTSELQSPI